MFIFRLPIGIKTGANATIVSSGYPVYEKRLKPGFHVGAFTSLRLNKFITFQPELVFSFQGTRAEYGSFSIIPYASGITSIHLSYLTLPLVLKLNVYRGFNAQFALQPGVLIAARERGEVNVDPRVQPPGGAAFPAGKRKGELPDLRCGSLRRTGVRFKIPMECRRPGDGRSSLRSEAGLSPGCPAAIHDAVFCRPGGSHAKLRAAIIIAVCVQAGVSPAQTPLQATNFAADPHRRST